MKHRKSTKLEILQLLALCLTVFLCTGILQAQHDPGPRGGPKGAGGGFPTLNADEKVMFATALNTFNEVQSVSGTIETATAWDQHLTATAALNVMPSLKLAAPARVSPVRSILGPIHR